MQFNGIERKMIWGDFEKNIYKKYFQYPSVIPFRNRETKCYNMALIKKRFWELEKKNVFQNPLYFEKSNLALVGPNLHSRTILQKQISFICMKAPRTEWVPHLDDYRPTLP